MAVPATRLTADLQALLAHAGARTVRVVDGRAGRVVAQAGDAASGPDDPAAVAGLLREAVALGEGGLDDVLVTTDRSLHVLRPAPVAGVFVHLRLDLGADPVRARRALADPALQDAVRRAVTADPAPVPDLTAPLAVVAPEVVAPEAGGPDVPAETVAVPVVAAAPAAAPTVTPPAAPRSSAPSAVAATFGRAPALPARVAPEAVGEEAPVLAEPAASQPAASQPAASQPAASQPAEPRPAEPRPAGPRPAGPPPAGSAPAAPASGGSAGPRSSSGGGLFTPVTPAEPEARTPAPEAGTAIGAGAAATWVDPATEPALTGPGPATAQAVPQPRPADDRSGSAAPDAAEAPPSGAAETDEPGAAEHARPEHARPEHARTEHAGTTTRRTRSTAPGQQPALAVLAADPARSGAGARAAVALAELSRPDAPPVVLPRRRSAGTVRSVPAPRSGGSTSGLPDRAWAEDLDTLRRLADGLRRLS